MIEKYEKELKELRERMYQAEAFAEKVPEFADIILSNKYTMYDEWIQFTQTYKGMPFPWGINRSHFSSDSNRVIFNYPKSYNVYLWKVYINTLTLYGEHVKFGLYDIVNDTDVFFLDKDNSTFYATDEQIIPLLDRLVEWYNNALSNIKDYRNKLRIDELKRELEKLEG
jgi:hypothetical protein